MQHSLHLLQAALEVVRVLKTHAIKLAQMRLLKSRTFTLLLLSIQQTTNSTQVDEGALAGRYFYLSYSSHFPPVGARG